MSQNETKYNEIATIFCAITDIETEYNGSEKSVRGVGFYLSRTAAIERKF